MYFTIHGKNIEFMLLQCVEHKREREWDIWKPAKYDGGRGKIKKTRMGKKKLKEIVIDTCWLCVCRKWNEMWRQKVFLLTNWGGKLLTENFPERRFSIEWISKWCTKRQDINSCSAAVEKCLMRGKNIVAYSSWKDLLIFIRVHRHHITIFTTASATFVIICRVTIIAVWLWKEQLSCMHLQTFQLIWNS